MSAGGGRSRRAMRALALVVCAVLLAPRASAQSRAAIESDTRPGVRKLGQPSLRFTVNQGQWETDARYVARRDGLLVRCDDQGFWFQVRTRDELPSGANALALRVVIDGRSTTSELVAESQLPGHESFFLGNDPAQWRSQVPAFGQIRWRNAWDGVDLLLRPGEGEAFVEYLLEVQPGADPTRAVLRIEGSNGIELGAQGRIRIGSDLGSLELSAPRALQTGVDASSFERACNFECLGGNEWRVNVPEYDRDRPLTIDPGLVWCSFLGGVFDELGRSLDRTEDGNVLITGWTQSPNFPSTPGAYSINHPGGFESFASKLSASGSSLVFSSFLGGSGDDIGMSVCEQTSGGVIVAGHTTSVDFPVTTASFDITHNGDFDAFVAKLSADGSELRFGTFLGGTDIEVVRGLGASDAIYFTGETYSANFPVTPGAAQSTFGGVSDAFVSKLSLDGKNLEWSTYFGGAKRDFAWDLALSAAGRLVIAGDTRSADLPLTSNALDTQYSSAMVGVVNSGFVAEHAVSNGQLLYGSYLDGSLPEFSATAAASVAINTVGQVGIVGGSLSNSLPFPPWAYKPTTSGGDAFAMVFAPDWSAVEAGTYFGSSQGGSEGHAVLLEDSGAIVLAGHSYSPTFPLTPGAWGSWTSHKRDITITRFSPKADAVLYSTCLTAGPASVDHSLFDALLDSDGDVWVLGNAGSGVGNPTTPGAFDTTWNGEAPAVGAMRSSP
jgi:hypothetical protein